MSDVARQFEQANQLRNAGRLEEAIGEYQKIIESSPEHVGALVNLGTVWAMRSGWDEAAEAYRRAALLAPSVPAIQYNLSNALEAACAWDKAMEAAQAGMKKWPDDPLMAHHLGVAYYNVGEFVEAMGAYRKAIEMKPDFAMAHCDLSALLILTGDAEGGWREYEWRWRAVEPGRLHAKFTGATFWDGSDPAGKRIIFHTEGGFGDAIQYFRYAPMMAKRGARVIVRCQRGVVELFKTLRGVERVIGVEEELPEFDWHCPLFSVPRVMGVVVGDVPYLREDVAKAAAWRGRVLAGKLNVGLVWAGGTGTAHDRIRSMKLADFAPLAGCGARFYSLQKGEQAGQAKKPPAGMELIDFSEELRDWTDTAALAANLDLVISVDTAAAHLAGALGRPVWTAIQYVPDPRWMLGRADTPWYPTMRLFRQEVRDEWNKPVEEMAGELKRLCARLSPGRSA